VWNSSFSASKDFALSYPGEKPPVFQTFGNDSIPTRCHTGDSVIALIQSGSIPVITAEANGTENSFSGIKSSNGYYYVAIPPDALGDSTILTIISQSNISYRKLLIREGPSAISNSTQRMILAATPLIRGNRVFVPRGSSWRIVDMLGRQIRLIRPANNEWTAPQRLASMPLFLVPCGNTKGKIVRFMITQ
jgi:hypothetical protein